MDFSFQFHLASFTSIVYNNLLLGEVHPSWQNATASSPTKDLNLVCYFGFWIGSCLVISNWEMRKWEKVVEKYVFGSQPNT